MSPDDKLTVDVAEGHAGARLDKLLAEAIADFSRSRLQALIKAGAVTLQGRAIMDPGWRVKAGETYVVEVPPVVPAEPAPETIPLAVVYEDEDIIVIDKPAGMVVHPAAGHASGTLVNALIAHCGDSLSGIGGVKRPGIVHRLDKDTSGLLVVAKTDQAHQDLSDQFRAHGADGRLERRYRALVWGAPIRPRGTVEAALARSRANRTKISVSEREDARHAVTHFEVLEVFKDGKGQPLASLVELVLETGRTHQIRVHMAHIGHPVLGDRTYGSGFATSVVRLDAGAREALGHLDRQALHAAVLQVTHPASGEPLRFESELPEDMSALLSALRATPVDAAPKGGARSRNRQRRG
ncbi:MAG: RluA family pseudouridine synthase [Hyphomicrobiaceae bacterium]